MRARKGKYSSSEAAPGGLATINDPADLCCALDEQGFPDTYEEAVKRLAMYGKWTPREVFYEASTIHHQP